MITYNTMIVLIGAGLLGASSGLVGSFAVLRRRSLTGDALAHAALPGLCIAFLLVGERSLPAMLFGAFVSGLLGIGIISALCRWTRIREDAAIGIVLSVFFGAGIALSRSIQNSSSKGSKAGLDSYILGKTAGMIFQDVVLIAGLAFLCLLILLIFYKEFRIVAFDPSFARVQGWPAVALDLLLMGLVAVAVVIGLPAVGVVLMASLLILPGASARFWTDELDRLLILATLFGLLIGVTGTLVSTWASLLPAGPIIVLTGTALFLISLLFAPRRGVLSRLVRKRHVQRTLLREKLLTLLNDLTEGSGATSEPWNVSEILRMKSWSMAQLRALVQELLTDGLLQREGAAECYRLSQAGMLEAGRCALNQRLWQLILTEHAEWSGCLASLEMTSLSDTVPPDFLKQLDGELRDRGQYPLILLGQ